ncbi:MAG: peroxidase family protein [Phycisphaerae bacterium]|nr:peroxidase family protein [Phycisphaerae bacterium]
MTQRWLWARTVCIGAALTLAMPADGEDRTFDGSGNNVANPTWGATGTPLLRVGEAAYVDEISLPAGPTRPPARSVSMICGAQSGNILSDVALSNLHTVWGQFLDHDITLTPDGSGEAFPLEVPVDDPWFDPFGTGRVVIPLMRSSFDPASGTGPRNPRQQINAITAYIDASMVYGSSPRVAELLRRLDGSGMLRTSPGDLLPYNDLGVPMANPTGLPPESLFAAGDVRANENCQLTAMHTLFLREHNRLCVELALAHPDWTGEELYQRARKLVGAYVQNITAQEYMPVLVGAGVVPSYAGYDDTQNAGIINSFQTVAFRLGHSQVNEVMVRVDDTGAIDPAGNIATRQAFFAPDRFVEVSVGSWLGGAALTVSQRIDLHLAGSLRNFLFGPPGSGGLDLFALNCQRSRDHGITDYNQLRLDFGLTAMNGMDQITADPVAQARLELAYDGAMNDIDPWVGGLAEDHAPGAAVGELFATVLVEQFTRLRDGDRFWFEHDDAFTEADRAAIRTTTLADIVRRNTGSRSFPAEPFVRDAATGFVPLLADLTLDGVVNFEDLVALLASWGPLGTPGQDPRADVDGDADVGFRDLLMLLAEWSG